MWRDIYSVLIFLTLSHYVSLWQHEKQYAWPPEENDILKHQYNIRMRLPRYSINITDTSGESPFKFASRKAKDFFISERTRKSVIVYPNDESACTSRKYTENLRRLRQNVNCKLRSRLVELEGAGGEVLFPKTIILKHCEGDCIGGKKCIPNGAREVEFYVQKFGNGKPVCSIIKVLEDTGCRCGCPNRNTCPKTHRLTPGCKCVCRNERELKTCSQRTDLQWNSTTCKCECRYIQFCTTGTNWSEETCRNSIITN